MKFARLGLFVLLGFGSVCGAQERCVVLQGSEPTSSARIVKAHYLPADPARALPAFCELTVHGSSGPGSRITMVYRLPDNWNGRMLGLGSGGWAGSTILFPMRPSNTTAATGLARGYATAQSDAGHPEPEVLAAPSTSDVRWVENNPVAVKDFSYLAVHETAVLGKQIVSAYYGRSVNKSYFLGCSTGGRQGMMETQRYPDDYDGVVAGAPVYTLMVQSSSTVRSRYFESPGAAIDRELLAKVHAKVISACDANDGLADGVITDPRRCKWDPVEMQCGAGNPPGSCLVPAQVDALRKAYSTVRTQGGLVGVYGLSRGSELAWNPGVMTTPVDRNAMNGALGALVPLMFEDPSFDLSRFDIEKHQAVVHASAFARDYEANSTDLSRYFARGGKLILWHGFNDAGPSPFATQDYYERAVKSNGEKHIRFFAAPGVNHCADGDGADRFELLTALENWVEKGSPPERLTATNPRKGFKRPLCAWPKLPAYTGGDPDSAASFACR